MGFWSLQRLRIRRSTCREPCHSPLRSARRVWLPSRRFTPSEPVPAIFHAGGAHGIRPSELSPSGRYPPRFRAEAPTRRFSRRFLPPHSGGPAQRAAASGLRPFRESLATAAGLVQRPPVAPLGFSLSGFAAGTLHEVHPCSSPALSRTGLSARTPAPRSLSQYQPRPIHRPASRFGIGQPSQGLRTRLHPSR
jgi:hypothetical protein